MKANVIAFSLSATLVVGTAAAMVRVQAEVGALETERQRLSDATDALRGEAKACREELRAVETAQVGQSKTIAEVGAREPAALARLVNCGLAVLHARVAAGNAVPPPEPTPSLLQSKPGKIYFPELLDQSDYAAAAAVVERLQIEIIYAPLFHTLGLAPDRRSALAGLLLDREMAKQDVFGVDQGAAASIVMQHRVDAAREWQTRVRTAFGLQVFKEILAFDGTILLRTAVDQLQTRTASTETPLAPEQAGAVFAALLSALGDKVVTRYWSVPEETIGQLRPVLAPEQVVVLRQIREEQLALIEARDAGAARNRPN